LHVRLVVEVDVLAEPRSQAQCVAGGQNYACGDMGWYQS
jgi:hypothetical protein